MRYAPARVAVGVLLLAVAGCAFGPSPTPQPTPSSSPGLDGPSGTPSPSPSPSPSAEEATAAASPSQEPPLSLEPPAQADPRVVSVTVTPEVAADGGGRILVSVTSLADSRIDELVLRWPEGLGETLVLAPFARTPERIAEGGDPLVQEWTKWVLGPGEQGEPAGTVSLGWGPLLPGATLEIPILVTRVAPGPVAFDLQVLAGNALLTAEDGGGLELRVEVD